MKRRVEFFLVLFVWFLVLPNHGQAEILAMVTFESKNPKSLRSFKLSGRRERREGIAIVDVDPGSQDFGNILMTIPLPPELRSLHLFYERQKKKVYLTAQGKSELHVLDLRRFPYRLQRVAIPDCKMGQNIVFSEDNKSWYLSCLMSERVIVGDVATNKIKQIIEIKDSYPHGLAILNALDRLVVTSTMRGDLSDRHEQIFVLEASSGRVIARHKVSNKKSPSGAAPLELLRLPGISPPVVYITNMFGATLWAATWKSSKRIFDVGEIFDFGGIKAAIPSQMYFNEAIDRLYVTTAKPGKFHIFEISADPLKPKLMKSLTTADGSHHVAFDRDGRYAFVQNALMNLPGMSDGSISIIDLREGKVVRSLDSLKNIGLNPNSIILLPQWHRFAGQ